MSGSLNYSIDGTGVHLPTFDELVADLKAEMRSIYGQDIYLENDSQDGQILGIVSKAWDDINSMLLSVYAAFSPATAQGTGLSSMVKINGIARAVPTRSTVDLLIVGQVGKVITNGQAANDQGVRWNLPVSVVIPVEGEITVTATAALEGDTRADPDTITTISTVTRGWQTVTNPSAAVPGQPVESDATLRIRQAVSTALPSLTVLDGLIGGIASLLGVTRYRAYENDEGGTDGNGIPGHTLSLVIEGGDVQEIADTIGLKKAPGVGTYGTTNATYTDFYGIDHPIHFYRPTIVNVEVEIALKDIDDYTSVIGDQVRQAVFDYINALRIGDPVYWSKVFVPANLDNMPPSDTYEIVQISLSRDGDPVQPEDVVIAFNEAAAALLDDITVVVVT